MFWETAVPATLTSYVLQQEMAVYHRVQERYQHVIRGFWTPVLLETRLRLCMLEGSQHHLSCTLHLALMGELMKRQVCSMHLGLVSSHVVILYLFTYTDGAGIPSTHGLILPKAA